MASQNLISAALPAQTKTEILASLADIKSKLGFLLSLQGEEIQSLIKVGKGYAPFLDRAYRAAEEHPQILPSVFDASEFKKDYSLAGELTPILTQVDELADGLRNTLTAAASDAMTGALDIYAAVRQNRDRVPGLNVVADEMAAFFKKGSKKAAQKAV